MISMYGYTNGLVSPADYSEPRPQKDGAGKELFYKVYYTK